MKFRTTKAVLQEALNTISGAVTSSSSLPVLEHVLLKTEGDRLNLRSTDLELSLETSARVEVEETGSCSVPARKLQNLIQSLPSASTEFLFELEDEQVEISIDEINSRFQLPALEEEEFPTLPEPEEDKLSFSVSTEELKDRLRNTHFAASSDSTRAYLGGVLFDIEDAELALVATDSHRLALQRIDLGDDFTGDVSSILVPVKAIKELVKIMPDEGEVKISGDENLTEFNFSNTRLVTRLIDEEFPDYHRVIPDDFEERITIDRERLQDAVKRVSLLADEKTKRLMLEFGSDEITVRTEDSEEGTGVERMEIEDNREEMTIAFNGDYLAEVLKHVRDPEIHLDLISADSPGTFRPMEGDDYLFIVMPMRLS